MNVSYSTLASLRIVARYILHDSHGSVRWVLWGDGECTYRDTGGFTHRWPMKVDKIT
jgi:hypothetical protein